MFRLALDELILLEPDHVIVGMARGWDMAVAGAAYVLGIPFTAAVPFPGQADRWPPEEQARYVELMSYAAEVETLYSQYGGDVYKWRDEWMVDHGDLVLSLLNPEATNSGTALTVRYATRKSVPVLGCWDKWVALGHGRGYAPGRPIIGGS